MYRIEISQRAAKEIRRLPKPQLRLITRRIDALRINPRPEGAIILRGHAEMYRIRQGNYRVVYSIKDEVLTVLILKIGHRKDVYKRLP